MITWTTVLIGTGIGVCVALIVNVFVSAFNDWRFERRLKRFHKFEQERRNSQKDNPSTGE